MLAEKHRYEMRPLNNSVYVIDLYKIGDDTKRKRFIQVGYFQPLKDHMESLTDVICADFMKTAERI